MNPKERKEKDAPLGLKIAILLLILFGLSISYLIISALFSVGN
jgi:hypothetical protein